MAERWKPVVGYEGLYEVSDHGRVRGISRAISWQGTTRRIPGRFMCPDSDHYYLRVTLSRHGKGRRFLVHCLVLEAFIGPRPDGMQTCHYPDANPANCHLDNLRWASPKENGEDKVKHGNTVSFKGSSNPNAALVEADVRRLWNLHRRGFSQRKIAAAIGTSQRTVWDIIHGRKWTHVHD